MFYRWTRLREAKAHRSSRCLEAGANPQRPCKIACSLTVADFGVQTPQRFELKCGLLKIVK